MARCEPVPTRSAAPPFAPPPHTMPVLSSHEWVLFLPPKFPNRAEATPVHAAYSALAWHQANQGAVFKPVMTILFASVIELWVAAKCALAHGAATAQHFAAGEHMRHPLGVASCAACTSCLPHPPRAKTNAALPVPPSAPIADGCAGRVSAGCFEVSAPTRATAPGGWGTPWRSVLCRSSSASSSSSWPR